ncbi:putative ABC transport system substrate-binding protein [Bradyrhizobium sp. Rc2d]|uniref:ABC transporter substrate-binding protein n=1 Tax=Bradyrhizobium sp. Rc2d TaxID=1855321 RepID=UPI00088EDC52|nr:ABC transporter substrate-binding protein [Bradyrhizobium sp. Rc2d]SDK01714.1 putative ABC transport system substrate-binding protein [Bradyrhizobium sp. Rc2d]
MRRAVLICAVLAALSPKYAEAAERVWRLGVLTLPGIAGAGAFGSIMLPYLATRGYVEGRNLVLDVRVGTEEQLPALGQALVGDKADVIVATSDWAVHAVRAATSAIPIVAAPMGADPVRAGVAESWAHPGGNVTGVCLIAPELEAKRLSLLREALPTVHRVAVLSNHRKVVEADLPPLRKAAAEAGLELVEIWVESPDGYAGAFDAMRGLGVEAVVVVPTPELFRDSEPLAALATKARLPTIGGFRESAQRGFLIGYGPNLRELTQQAASYVERLFNGAHAGELPFQGPTQFDFAINMKAAKALGVTIPPSLLVGAEVID